MTYDIFKRLAAFLLAASMTFCLFACTGDDIDDNTTESGTGEIVESDSNDTTGSLEENTTEMSENKTSSTDEGETTEIGEESSAENSTSDTTEAEESDTTEAEESDTTESEGGDTTESEEENTTETEDDSTSESEEESTLETSGEDVTTAECTHNSLLGDMVKNQDGSLLYTYKCASCGTKIGERAVSSEINRYDDMTAMDMTNMSGELKYDSKGGFSYISCVGNDVFAQSGGYVTLFNEELSDPGRYLVIKYRTSGSMDISLRIGATHHWLSKADTPKEWRVYVVDISQSADYGFNAAASKANELYLRLFCSSEKATAGYTIDIAYVAIADNIEEARKLLSAEEGYHTSFVSDSESKWVLGGECNNDGECIGECSYAWMTAASDDDIMYQYRCIGCEEVLETRKVPSSINKYYTPDKFTSSYNNRNRKPTRTEEIENGIVFTRFVNAPDVASSTALTLVNKESISGGDYLVIKYRTDCSDDKTKMRFSVKSVSATNSSDSKTYNTGDISYLKQPTDGFWLTGYVDLKGTAVEGLITSDREVTVTITMIHDGDESEYTVDIAYLAFVNTLDEAQKMLSVDERLTDGLYDLEWSAAEFNRDLAPLIKDKADNELQFIHFADIHRGLNAWNRVVEYYNEYSDYIDFAVHSGDYVGAYNSTEGGNYNDLYNKGTQSVGPVYNVVGNHDIYAVAGGSTKLDKADVIDTLFNKTDNWNVNYMGGSAVNTSYYRDFADQKVRFIVLDNYHSESGQAAWLEELLEEAKEMDYHVLTSMHEPTARVVTPIDTAFHSSKVYTSGFRTSAFDKILGDFIKDGGKFIANLTGHWHIDYAGYTANGVLNLSVEIGSAGAVGSEQLDGRPQIQGERGYDAFNVINVNASTGIFEIVRIGNNSDSIGREKTSLVYDYLNKTVISENGSARQVD